MLTYDVRVYSIETRPDRPKPYRVRWLVGPQKHSKSYTLKAQADGRRSELMTALRKGDQFDVETGLPASELRTLHGSVTWYEHTHARTSTADGTVFPRSPAGTTRTPWPPSPPPW